ncbi:MAG: esterase/lipase family protein, partial [Actinomycetota bacterium]
FRTVSTLNYNVIGHNVEELAEQLGAHVDRVLAETGAPRVHLVGHSLGGIVARAYIQMGGGEQTVHTCITLGSPHAGTYSAYAGRGRAARDIRPESPFMRSLAEAPPSDVRFVSYYSNLDAMIIPASNAKIDDPRLKARNVLVKDAGHMSLLISQQLIASIIDVLRDLEEAPQATVVPMAKRKAGRKRGA